MYSDDAFKSFGEGMLFDFDHYDTVIENNCDGVYYNEATSKNETLFRLRKGVIDKTLQDQATGSFLKLAKRKTYNRGIAAGKVEGSTTVREIINGQSQSKQATTSNIAGYYDRPDRIHRKYFETTTVCRKTAFTNKNRELWDKGLPFIQKCSKMYKYLGGRYYARQKDEYDKIHPKMKIPDTVFTTITVNYNWQTACHKDQGDYSQGLGNLIVTGKDFDGCYLGFPQFKVCIKVEPGDFLLMDVHQYHCNTALELKTKDAYRLSFVMYLREKMSKCKKKVLIDKYEYYY